MAFAIRWYSIPVVQCQWRVENYEGWEDGGEVETDCRIDFLGLYRRMALDRLKD